MRHILPSEPIVTKRAARIAWTVVAVLAALLAGWLVYTVVHQSDQIRHEQGVNTAQDNSLAEANRRLIEAGEKPVPTPEPGPAGEAGQVGPQGPAGPPGATGPTGSTGPRGHAGKAGVNGERGMTGAPGARGAIGLPGPQGERGEKGDAGPQGPAGPAGRDGQNGTDGQDGKDGQSAFPFQFSFTVQTTPAQSTTYTVTCTADGCTVTEQ